MPDSKSLLSRTEVVLVSYRSRPHVEALLGGWPSELAVAVVDNAGNSDGLRELVGRFPHARYLDGGGQGFGRAANLGAFSSDRENVVFVNPDCRPSADDLLRLVEGLSADADAAAHAATMTNADGTIEAGVGGWEPSLGRLAVHAFGLGGVLRTQGFFARPRPGEAVPVDWTTGACMVVRKDTFERLGGFDESFYVYAEDVSYGRSARAQGLRCVLRPDVLVRHGAGSSGAPSLEMLRLRGASFAGYLTRYHGWRAIPMRGLMVLGAVLRGSTALLAGRRAVTDQQRAFIMGLVTRTAFVGGTEVAARRYREVTGAARS